MKSNGAGETALNGVYIAVLKTSTGVATTKVAMAEKLGMGEFTNRPHSMRRIELGG